MSTYILKLLDKRTPVFLSNIQLQILMCLAAKSFDDKPQWILFKRHDKALDCFARYTVYELEKSSSNIDTIADKLFHNAYHAGLWLKKLLHIFDENDLRLLITLLYRNIGITLEWNDMQQFTVRNCYFAKYYSPVHCHVMSNMDSGIINGVLGSGTLQFYRRMTDGNVTCEACFYSCSSCAKRSVLNE